MKKRLFYAAVLLFSANVQAQPDAFRLIDQWIAAQRDFQRIPGMSVGIVKDQQLVWSKAYGMANLKNDVPATPGTVYSICSISKLFTSIAVMQLYEAGKLRLDDSLAAVLPGFNIKQAFKDSGPITIRSLLTHSSGLPRESDYPYWTGPDFPFPTRQQINDRLGQQKTLYPASTYFQYSNLGMSLLGQVIEKISGKPYDAYVEENILKPLRLAETHPFLPAAQWGTKMAIGYGALKRDGSRDPVALFDARGVQPAAGYSSNVEDLARFASWQFRLLKNGGKEILKSSTLKEMQRVQWVDPDWKTNWGLGFVVSQVDGKTLIGHGGSCPGYRTTILIDPQEKYAYIVMINAGGESPEKFTLEIRNIILKAQKEKFDGIDTVLLSAYAGRYSNQPWGSESLAVPWFGKLAVVGLPTDKPRDGMMLLKYISGNTFRRVRSDDTLGEEITFEKNAAGKVIKMWHNSNFSTKVSPP
jgi:CubicO group peptidase (beta-lactamase class C family)